MIGQRQVPIVGRQGAVGAEQPADILGVDDRGVEVGVVADFDGQVQDGVGQRHEGLRLGPRRVGAEDGADRAPQAGERGRAQGQQGVENSRFAGGLDDRGRGVQETELAAAAKVQHLVADGHADARGLGAPAAAEDAQGQVLDGEVAAGVVGADHPASQARVVRVVDRTDHRRVLTGLTAHRSARPAAGAEDGGAASGRAVDTFTSLTTMLV